MAEGNIIGKLLILVNFWYYNAVEVNIKWKKLANEFTCITNSFDSANNLFLISLAKNGYNIFVRACDNVSALCLFHS